MISAMHNGYDQTDCFVGLRVPSGLGVFGPQEEGDSFNVLTACQQAVPARLVCIERGGGFVIMCVCMCALISLCPELCCRSVADAVPCCGVCIK